MELSDQLQETQLRLAKLQQEQQQIEQQRRRLEELSRKQQEVEEGRKEMAEKLRRSQVLLERHEQMSLRELETIQQTRKTFAETLVSVEQIVPEEWDPNNLENDLTEALSRIEVARTVFQKHNIELDVVRNAGEPAGSLEPGVDGGEVVYETEPEFMTLVKRGFATHLPLILLGIVALVLFWIKR
jgi:anion-transporting  ArsA/GET3 family ATPase